MSCPVRMACEVYKEIVLRDVCACVLRCVCVCVCVCVCAGGGVVCEVCIR